MTGGKGKCWKSEMVRCVEEKENEELTWNDKEMTSDGGRARGGKKYAEKEGGKVRKEVETLEERKR